MNALRNEDRKTKKNKKKRIVVLLSILEHAEIRSGKLLLRPYQQDKYHTVFRQTVFDRCKAYAL